MNKLDLAAAVRWIADNDGLAVKHRSAIAQRTSVKMLAALAETTADEIAALVVVARGGRRRRTDPAGLDAAFAFIERFATSNGMPPTYKEIAEALSIPGGAGAAYTVVMKLSEAGRVRMSAKQRHRGLEIIRTPKDGLLADLRKMG